MHKPIHLGERVMNKNEDIRSYTAEELRAMKAQSKTDLCAFDSMTDDELEHLIAEDPDERDLRPDWTLAHMAVPPLLPMTDEQIEAAALSDPDAQPITPENEGELRRRPRTKTLRRALGLTQEEFAARYQIPIGMIRDWEQGRAEPDQPTRAYLRVIANDPEGTSRALQTPRA